MTSCRRFLPDGLIIERERVRHLRFSSALLFTHTHFAPSVFSITRCQSDPRIRGNSGFSGLVITRRCVIDKCSFHLILHNCYRLYTFLDYTISHERWSCYDIMRCKSVSSITFSLFRSRSNVSAPVFFFILHNSLTQPFTGHFVHRSCACSQTHKFLPLCPMLYFLLRRPSHGFYTVSGTIWSFQTVMGIPVERRAI